MKAVVSYSMGRELALCLALFLASAVWTPRGAVVFPGEFAPGSNWDPQTQDGAITMDPSTLVITGPGGDPTGSERSSIDVMYFLGPTMPLGGRAGVSVDMAVSFHYRLEAGNSLSATALFGVGGGSTTLASTAYGGTTVEGDFQTTLNRGDQFAFALDSQTYKGTAAKLTITDFTSLAAVPEASVWWAGSALIGIMSWRRWRSKVRGNRPPPLSMCLCLCFCLVGLPAKSLLAATDPGRSESSSIANPATTNPAAIPPTAPAVGLSLVATEINTPTNGLAQAAIGELVDYAVTVTLPDGITPGVVLTNTLHPGVTFVSLLSTTLSSGVTRAAAAPTVAMSSVNGGANNRAVFTCGNVTNVNTDAGVPDTLTLTYRAVVLNVAGNVGGASPTQLTNGVTLSYTGGSTLAAAAPSVSVIEPRLSLTAQVSADNASYANTLTNQDAGNPVFYRLVLTNPAGITNTTAYDLTLSDPVPAQITALSVVSVATTGAFYKGGGGSGLSPGTYPAPAYTPVAADFGFTGNTLNLLLTNLHAEMGSSLTVVVQGALAASVTPGQSIANTATLRWTSLNGVYAGARTANGASSTERSGSGGVNTYNASNTAGTGTITIAQVAPTNSIVATSEAHTLETGTGAATTSARALAVGEIIRFRLVTLLPEGTITNLQILDNLPAGLTFLNDSQVKIAFVANGPSGITSTTLSGAGLSISGNGPVTPTFTLPPSAITGSPFADGTDPVFLLGDVINNDSDADAEYVIVEFNAVVSNIAANTTGRSLSNTFAARRGTTVLATSAAMFSVVQQPVLTIAKTASVASLDGGDTVVFTVTITASGTANTTTAFDVSMTDLVPSPFTVTGVSTPTTTGTVIGATRSLAGNTLTLAATSMATNSTLSLAITNTTSGAVSAGQTITNTATVAWTSLPGASGTTSNPTGSSTPGAAGTGTGERTGAGGVNTYTVTATRAVAVLAPTVDKAWRDGSITEDDTGIATTYLTNVVVGETLTYDIKVNLSEGTNRLLRVIDTVPAGLRLDSYEIVTTNGASAGLAGKSQMLTTVFSNPANLTNLAVSPSLPATGPADVTFSFGDVFVNADNATTNNAFVLRIVATAINSLTNQAEINPTFHTNTARLLYRNTATGVDTTVNDATPANNPISAVLEPLLSISNSLNTNSADIGDTLIYTLSITNGYSVTNTVAHAVTISDILPAALATPTILNGPGDFIVSDVAVRAASTANIAGTFTSGVGNPGTFTGSPLTLDGVPLAVGDRVLLKNQSTPAQNGVYAVSAIAATTTLVRSTDFDTAAELFRGARVLISQGTSNAGTTYWITSTVATLNTSAVTWTITTSFTKPLVTDFQITNTSGTNVLSGKASLLLNVPPGRGIQLRIQSTLAATVNPPQTVTNLARIFWNSAPTNNAARRTGADDPSATTTYPNPALLNNYAVASQPATFSAFSHTLSGFAYGDLNNNAVRDPGEPVFQSVGLQLTGLDRQGRLVSIALTTGAGGQYLFTNLPPSNPAGYTLTRTTTPSGWNDGNETVGTSTSSPPFGGIAANTPGSVTITTIVIPPGSNSDGANYNFGLTTTASILGRVYRDNDLDGLFSSIAGDAGIPAVAVRLADGAGFSISVATDASGQYSQAVPAGTWTVSLSGSDPALAGLRLSTDAHGEAHNPATLTVSPGNSATQNFAFMQPVATLASLRWARVAETAGGTAITWETASEIGSVSFDVYRTSAESGERTRINETPIPANGSPTGASYNTYTAQEKQRARRVSSHSTPTYSIVENDQWGRSRLLGNLAVGTELGAQSQPPAKAATQAAATDAANSRRRAGLQLATPTTPISLEDLADDARIRIVTRARGPHRVAATDLATLLGQPEESVADWIAAGSLVLSNRGQLVSWSASSDRRAVLFQAEAIKNNFADANVYWLSSGTNTIVSVDGATPSPLPAATFETSTRVEQDLLATPTLALDPRQDLWMWKKLVAGTLFLDTATFPINLTATATNAGVPAKLRLRLVGANNVAHRVNVEVNGTAIGQASWLGTAPAEHLLAIPPGLLKEGANQVRLKALASPGGTGSQWYLDWFELAYQRSYTANAGALEGAADGNPIVSIDGFSSTNVFVWDTSKPHSTRLVRGLAWDTTSRGWRLSFKPESRNTRFAAFEPDSASSVISMELSRRTYLSDPSNESACVVVAPDSLMDAAQQLVSYRTSQGLASKLVRLQSVYDEFSDGIPSPDAIRACLRTAVSTWRVPPKYAVLAGNGTYDYRNLLHNGDCLVPPGLVSTTFGLFASDSVLGDINGDGVPEVAVGRLPAVTPEELAATIAKIFAYEAGGIAASPKALLVADSPDSGGQFAAEIELAAASLTGTLSPILVRAAGLQNLPETRAAIQTALGNGVDLVAYLGHGAIDRLGGIGQGYLSSADLPTLPLSPRLPVLVAGTCVAGQYSVPGYNCLAETLVLASKGGAIAVVAPSGLSWNSDASRLNLRLIRGLSANGHARLGDTFRTALGEYSRADSEQTPPWIYNLIGDPALLYQVPGGPQPTNQLPHLTWRNSPGTTLSAPATVTLRVDAFDTDGRIRRVQYFEGADLAGQSDTYPFDITLQAVSPGRHTYMAKATDDQGATVESELLALDVSQINHPPTINLSTPRPANAMYAEPVTMDVAASDDDGQVLRIEIREDNTVLLSAEGNPASVTLDQLPAGHHTIHAIAIDNQGAIGRSSDVELEVLPFSVSIETDSATGATLLRWTGGRPPFFVEQTDTLGSSTAWRTTTPPLRGTNTLLSPRPAPAGCYYRLRGSD